MPRTSGGTQILIDAVRKKGLTRRKAELVVGFVISYWIKALASGARVELPGMRLGRYLNSFRSSRFRFNNGSSVAGRKVLKVTKAGPRVNKPPKYQLRSHPTIEFDDSDV